jgi:hypothetical protein
MFYRIFFVAIAYFFMAMGLLGAYLIGAELYQQHIDPLWTYPFHEMMDREGILLPLLYIIVGVCVFLLYRAHWQDEGNKRIDAAVQRRIEDIRKREF